MEKNNKYEAVVPFKVSVPDPPDGTNGDPPPPDKGKILVFNQEQIFYSIP